MSSDALKLFYFCKYSTILFDHYRILHSGTQSYSYLNIQMNYILIQLCTCFRLNKLIQEDIGGGILFTWGLVDR